MRIGFIKLGLKTYFKTTNKTKQGSGHELPTVWDIFEKKGHHCNMISGSDSPEKQFEGTNLFLFDYLFVFNGFAPKTLDDTNMNMLKQPLAMMKIINSFKGKVVYFWTDPRYDPKLLPITKEMIVLSQEPEYYSHLDKLILYKKEIRPLIHKDIEFAILMNWTERKRANNAITICNVLKKYDPIIIGDWKKKLNEFISHEVVSSDVQSLLDQVKYSWNQTVKLDWISQKFWEMILSNVICFHYNSDMNKLVIPDWLRVNKTEEIKSTIEITDANILSYQGTLMMQKALIVPEYLDGSFIYNQIIAKIQ